jgi:hypothetical protein
LLGRLGLLPAVFLVLALGATGLHHHLTDETGRGCAVCAAGHAPGVAPVPAIQTAPAVHTELVHPAPVNAPARAPVTTPGTRAPPSL